MRFCKQRSTSAVVAPHDSSHEARCLCGPHLRIFMRSLEQPRQSREYLAKLMTKVFLLEDVQQQRRRVAALSTKSSASLILIQKLLSLDGGITYDLAHATAGCHGCSARHRPCCYTACSGNHFSDALWNACLVTFLDEVLGLP